MKNFWYLFIIIFFTQSSDYNRLLLRSLSHGSRSINYTLGDEIRLQIDDLKGFLQRPLAKLASQTQSDSGKKFISLLSAYIVGNLITLYMIQQSITMEYSPELINIRRLTDLNKKIIEIDNEIKLLIKKYNLPFASVEDVDLQTLDQAIIASGATKDREIINKIFGSYFEAKKAKSDIEAILQKFNLSATGKGILDAFKEQKITLGVSYDFFEDFINTIESLLRFKSFLYEGQALKMRNSLYRFIQLYSIFLIIDEIDPIEKSRDILAEMLFLGNQLQSIFQKELQVIVAQSTQKLDPLTLEINKNNKELIQAFSRLLITIEQALTDVELKLFSNDLIIVVNLLL